VRLSPSTLNWSLAHVERFGDTDIFPLPFEYEAIRADWGRLLAELTAVEINDWVTSAYRRALTPKSRFGFRTATQLDPLDSLIFSALVYDIAKDLEGHRDPARERRVFSHRVKRGATDGQLYDPKWNFDAFKAHLREKCASEPTGWVVSTDVADFYSRIYHHPLDNALRTATSKTDHVDAIMRLLSEWNYVVSSGIPVGPAASRILAEMALVDVDQTLGDKGIDFCRFSDDFRLFAPTEREAHDALAVLARALGESHLTLSERKTDILPAVKYSSRHIDGERPGDAASLAGRVTSILEKYGYENDLYSEAELEALPAGMVRELEELDLNTVLRERAVDSRSYDVFMVSLSLRRLAQLKDDALSELVIENLHQFTPVFAQTMNYFRKVTPEPQRSEVGRKLLESTLTGASGHREYQLCWLLDLFSGSPDWCTVPALRDLYQADPSVIVRPKLLELLGDRGQAHFFRQGRRDVLNLSPWEQRAFIKGGTCMRQDEFGPWIRSLRPRLDRLGQTVADTFRRRAQS